MKENVDNWIRLMGDDIDKVAYMWADELGKALNGGNTGQLDSVIESLKAHTIAPETTSDNAAEQIARLVKWRIKLLKFGMYTNSLLSVVQAITLGLDSLILKVADDTYIEEIELDYLPTDPESMALPVFNQEPEPEPEPETKLPPDPPREWHRQETTRKRVPRI